MWLGYSVHVYSHACTHTYTLFIIRLTHFLQPALLYVSFKNTYLDTDAIQILFIDSHF